MKKNNGFSLIEVLVFVTIIGFVFIAAAAVGTVSLRNSQNSQNKIFATRYAQELHDWLSSQKDADWVAFVGRTGTGTATYCFDTEPVSIWGTSGNCGSGKLIDKLFKRKATLTYDDFNQRVNIEVLVSWDEGGNKFEIPINGVFALFE